MTLETDFIPLQLDQLHREAAVMKADGWRFIQTHAVNREGIVDLYYSFMKDGRIANYRVEGVKSGDPVASITDLFLAAFVFENEARELFGVNMRNIAIDFAGAMYAPAGDSPMTFISPEQKAAREKAKKVAAAKAAKAAKEAGEAKAKKAAEAAPEKAAADPAPQKPHAKPLGDKQVEALLGLMDDSKADVVRAALNMKGGD